MRRLTCWLRARPDRLAPLSTVVVSANVVALFLASWTLALTLQVASVAGFLLVLLLAFVSRRGSS